MQLARKASNSPRNTGASGDELRRRDENQPHCSNRCVLWSHRGRYRSVTALQNPTNSDGERQLPAADDDSSDLVTQFVGQHQTGLCRFLRLCGAGANAEELAQEAFLLANRRSLTTAEPGPAAALLRQTAKHLWLREWRDNREPVDLVASVQEARHQPFRLAWRATTAADLTNPNPTTAASSPLPIACD
ncbi:MAG: hypothetical protein ACI8UD_001377 [Planctomycetota bacterium]